MTEHNVREAGPGGLASVLLANGSLTTDWLPTFEAVPRELFVPDTLWPGRESGVGQGEHISRLNDPEAWRTAVYSDIPLTTQWDDGKHTGTGRGTTPTSSNSRPKLVFAMLAALDVEPGHKVLEIGTGTGWNAALLAHRVGAENVVTVEVDTVNAAEAAARLERAGVRPLSVVGDGALGFPQEAPYDRIMATCSIGSVPYAWVTQARPGGVILAPWGPAYGGEAITRLVVSGDGTASGQFVMSSAFMRLRDQRTRRPPRETYLKGADWPAGGDRRLTELSPDDMGDWVHMFTIGIQSPGMFCRPEWFENDAYRLWLFDVDALSWATADFEKGRSTYVVVQSGPRRLWDEVESAMAWWNAHDRPGFERFGLTVTPDGQHVWLDNPGTPVPKNG
ncbi:methyltransferase domain-containing protein [Streptomyces sp. RKAG293]|uniref:methyltransferase domain-containing protein n=1 Tax=Streptomyces sp. RKAG293 TaxID=2893403 RepID=UPI0020345327|nr:methyltransferase domain-containing protein [Streptomyces sp. RKAG293]MCM2419749.1 methyltransferase domain-containing protein [Streptomyces sp. RKAG293]